MMKAVFMSLAKRLMVMVRAPLRAWQQRPVVRQYPELLQMVRWFNGEAPKATMLYLGDSVSERISRDDQDTRDLKAMIADHLGPSTIASISYSGYHSEVFYHFLSVLEQSKHKPALVILPINLRSFSPQWYLNPQLQFEQEIGIIKAYLADPQKPIGCVRRSKDGKLVPPPPSRVEAYKSMRIEYPTSPFDRIGQFIDLIGSRPSSTEMDLAHFRKKQIFVFHYLHPLRADHVMLSYLTQIVRLLARINAALLMYVTPINYQAGEKCVGPEFTSILKSNAQTIRHEIVPRGNKVVKLLDWSTLLASKYFFGDEAATEHLNENGRRILAMHIADEVRQMSVGQNEPYAALEKG